MLVPVRMCVVYMPFTSAPGLGLLARPPFCLGAELNKTGHCVGFLLESYALVPQHTRTQDTRCR